MNKQSCRLLVFAGCLISFAAATADPIVAYLFSDTRTKANVDLRPTFLKAGTSIVGIDGTASGSSTIADSEVVQFLPNNQQLVIQGSVGGTPISYDQDVFGAGAQDFVSKLTTSNGTKVHFQLRQGGSTSDLTYRPDVPSNDFPYPAVGKAIPAMLQTSTGYDFGILTPQMVNGQLALVLLYEDPNIRPISVTPNNLGNAIFVAGADNTVGSGVRATAYQIFPGANGSISISQTADFKATNTTGHAFNYVWGNRGTLILNHIDTSGGAPERTFTFVGHGGAYPGFIQHFVDLSSYAGGTYGGVLGGLDQGGQPIVEKLFDNRSVPVWAKNIQVDRIVQFFSHSGGVYVADNKVDSTHHRHVHVTALDLNGNVLWQGISQSAPTNDDRLADITSFSDRAVVVSQVQPAGGNKYVLVQALVPLKVLTARASPKSVRGGSGGTFTTTFNAPTPTAIVVTYSTIGPVQLPASSSVQPGSVAVTVPFKALPTFTAATGSLIASFDNRQVSDILTVLPTAVTDCILPYTQPGGTTFSVAFTLNGPAPAGGCTISLVGTNLAVPPSVTIPAGADYVIFKVTAAKVSAESVAKITWVSPGGSGEEGMFIEP
jgi:hypothetical protein